MTQFVARLAGRIRAAGVTDVDPDVAAVALVAMIERLTYYGATRYLPADPDEITEVLATVAQRALFGET